MILSPNVPYAQQFCSLLHGSGEDESFVFFTDPHLFHKNDYKQDEDMFRTAEFFLSSLHDTYYSIPASFIVCGGDWIGNSDTMTEAKAKLGIVDGYMRKLFGDAWYPILGNHDTNYQGRGEDGTPNGADGGLSPEVQTGFWFRRFGHPYYTFRGIHTRFFILDSGIDWKETEMDEYKREQIAWLAGEFLSCTDRHIAVGIHAWYSLGDPKVIPAVTKLLSEMISAYNQKAVFSFEGTDYDYGKAAGRVEFVMSGHAHEDKNSKVGTCPVFCTTTFHDYVPRYDLVYADYDARKLSLLRVGGGRSRVFSLDTGDMEEIAP